MPGEHTASNKIYTKGIRKNPFSTSVQPSTILILQSVNIEIRALDLGVIIVTMEALLK